MSDNILEINSNFRSAYERSDVESIYNTFKNINNKNLFFLLEADKYIWDNNILSYIITKKDVFDYLKELYKVNELDLENLLYEFEIPLRKLKGSDLVNYLNDLQNTRLLAKIMSVMDPKNYKASIYDAHIRKDFAALSVYQKLFNPNVIQTAIYEKYLVKLIEYIKQDGIFYTDKIKTILSEVGNVYSFLVYIIDENIEFAQSIKPILYNNEDIIKNCASFYNESSSIVKDYILGLFVFYLRDNKKVNVDVLINNLNKQNIYKEVIEDIALKYKEDALLPFPGYYQNESIKKISDDLQRIYDLYKDYDILIKDMEGKMDNNKSVLDDIESISDIKTFFNYTSNVGDIWKYSVFNYTFIDSKYSDDYFSFASSNTKKARNDIINGIVSYITYHIEEERNINKILNAKEKLISYGLFNYVRDNMCYEFDNALDEAMKNEDYEIIEYINSIISLECKKRLSKNRRFRKIENKIKGEDKKEIMPILTPVFEDVVFKFLTSKKFVKETEIKFLAGNKLYEMDYDHYLRSTYFIIRNKLKYYENIEDLIFSKSTNIQCNYRDDYIYYNKYFDEYSYYPNQGDFLRFRTSNMSKVWQETLVFFEKFLYKDLLRCKDGFKHYSIYEEGKSIGHRVIIYFENINNNYTIYYYDPQGSEDTTSTSLRMYELFEFITDCLNTIARRKINDPYTFKLEHLFSGCPIGLQSFTSGFDIGMCQTFTLFWLYNIVLIKNFIRDIKYINELPMSKIIPRIEEYYQENLTDYELYNLLISFLSHAINGVLNRDDDISKELSIIILNNFKKEYLNRQKGDRIKITRLKDNQILDLQEKFKNYKVIIDDHETNVSKQITMIANRQMKEQTKLFEKEMSRTKNLPGRKLIDYCDYDDDCASECCAYSHKYRAKVCSPKDFCKEMKEKRRFRTLKKT
jgi:hypothetical protein